MVVSRNPLIVAADLSDLGAAERLARDMARLVGSIKVGLELFTAGGPDAVRLVRAVAPVFLDLKLHDIPNTVAAAVRAMLPLQPTFLTIHTSGGPAMMRTAAEAASIVGDPRMPSVAV